jgi:hypothetical protein
MKRQIALVTVMVAAALASSITYPQSKPRGLQKPSREAPANACVELSSSDRDIDSVVTRVFGAQIAYLHSVSEIGSIGTFARQCELIVFKGFGRLAELKSEGAALAIAKLVLDPELNWEYSGIDQISTYIVEGGIGPKVVPLLRSHTKESRLAERLLECLDGGYDTCMCP